MTPTFPRGYTPQRRLKRTNLSDVWLVLRESDQQQFVVKTPILPPDYRDEFLERFHREIRALQRLDHPNIIPIVDVGSQEAPCLVMPYAEGGNLRARLRPRPPDPRGVTELLRQLARGLAHAHVREIINRDIKPENILFTGEGTPMLADFGLMRDLAVESTLTGVGRVLGTPGYWAPEQVVGAKVDKPADVWSFGVVALECLTGQRPQPLLGATPPLHQLNPEIPPALEAICLRCLRPAPAHRYPDGGALAEDLERCLNDWSRSR